MDVQLLERALAERGEPGYRGRQVWRWAARGARSYEEMTDLPAPLRRELEAAVPFSTLALVAVGGWIAKVFYPVFPPDRNAQDVVDWLRATLPA